MSSGWRARIAARPSSIRSGSSSVHRVLEREHVRAVHRHAGYGALVHGVPRGDGSAVPTRPAHGGRALVDVRHTAMPGHAIHRCCMARIVPCVSTHARADYYRNATSAQQLISTSSVCIAALFGIVVLAGGSANETGQYTFAVFTIIDALVALITFFLHIESLRQPVMSAEAMHRAIQYQRKHGKSGEGADLHISHGVLERVAQLYNSSGESNSAIDSLLTTDRCSIPCWAWTSVSRAIAGLILFLVAVGVASWQTNNMAQTAFYAVMATFIGVDMLWLLIMLLNNVCCPNRCKCTCMRRCDIYSAKNTTLAVRHAALSTMARAPTLNELQLSEKEIDELFEPTPKHKPIDTASTDGVQPPTKKQRALLPCVRTNAQLDFYRNVTPAFMMIVTIAALEAAVFSAIAFFYGPAGQVPQFVVGFIMVANGFMGFVLYIVHAASMHIRSSNIKRIRRKMREKGDADAADAAAAAAAAVRIHKQRARLMQAAEIVETLTRAPELKYAAENVLIRHKRGALACWAWTSVVRTILSAGVLVASIVLATLLHNSTSQTGYFVIIAVAEAVDLVFNVVMLITNARCAARCRCGCMRVCNLASPFNAVLPVAKHPMADNSDSEYDSGEDEAHHHIQAHVRVSDETAPVHVVGQQQQQQQH